MEAATAVVPEGQASSLAGNTTWQCDPQSDGFADIKCARQKSSWSFVPQLQISEEARYWQSWSHCNVTLTGLLHEL